MLFTSSASDFFLYYNFFAPGFFLAMCLFIGLFLLPVFSAELRENKNILYGYWFILSLHLIVLFIQAYNYDGPFGVMQDARGFYKVSRQQNFYYIGVPGQGEKTIDLVFGIGAMSYKWFLSRMSRWFGESYLLGSMLSILVSSLSCIVFLKLMRQLNMISHKGSALIAFGALPSIVFYGSTTVRESYELFFFILAVYFGLKMLKKKGINIYIIMFILTVLFMGLLHRALFIYSLMLIVIIMFHNIQPAPHFWNVKKLSLLAFSIIALIIFALGAPLKIRFGGMELVESIINVSILAEAEQFRLSSASQGGGSTYGILLNLTSFYYAVYSTINIYVHYLFGPFPWQVCSLSTAYASVVAILRIVLIYFSIRQWRKSYGPQRKLLQLMLIIYFSITLMWAIGTTNYGTAARHQIMSWWIIVIIGVPPLMEKLSRVLSVYPERKHSN